jgi:hypothetical protein
MTGKEIPMFLTVHLLAAAMYAVLLTPLWLFLGLRFSIWLAHLRGGPTGWLAGAERILYDDRGSDVWDEPLDSNYGFVPIRAR